jgi:chemotaxis protein CheX
MSAVALPADPSTMPVNSTLLNAVVSSVQGAFTMCGLTARCVGASSVPVREGGNITGLIGVHGKVSGFITVNMTDRIAVRAVNSLLQENYTELNSQVVDATGEITNMVVGGVKSALATTKWSFLQITVPSVIIGKGYSIAYARGLEFLNVIFENDDKDALLLEDRLIQVSISLLTL